MVEYSNGGLKTGLKKPVYGSKCQIFKWSAKSCDFTIWIPDTHIVWYSEEYGIQVFDIQMVTVFQKVCVKLLLKQTHKQKTDDKQTCQNKFYQMKEALKKKGGTGVPS